MIDIFNPWIVGVLASVTPLFVIFQIKKAWKKSDDLSFKYIILGIILHFYYVFYFIQQNLLPMIINESMFIVVYSILLLVMLKNKYDLFKR